jgi:hypothetical protein
MPGYISEAAITGDGRRAAAISTTAWRPGEAQQDRQEKAMTVLVDRALCSAK